jgi:uncharacterized RDD family membrane protein YckC
MTEPRQPNPTPGNPFTPPAAPGETGQTPAPYAGQAPSGASGPRANFGYRLLAALVDGVILGVVYGIVYVLSSESAAGLIQLVVGIAYYTYLEGSPSGQTAGKRIVGIRVIDLRTGGSIGYGRALARYFGRILSTIPCLLGYFWMLWDREKQTWHDKLVTSVVVPAKFYPAEKWPG